jgi:hypothetical protein
MTVRFYALDTTFAAGKAVRLALWTANRPASRAPFDGTTDLKRYLDDRERAEGSAEHLTPLPTQAVQMLRDIQPITGHLEHVFTGRNDPRQPISDGAVAGMFKRIGYHKKQTMHGFRHLISTALNDKGYEADWVERQLAHGDPDKIRGIYNKAAYLEPRRKMMQEWADYLDLIKRKADVIPIRREVA